MSDTVQATFSRTDDGHLVLQIDGPLYTATIRQRAGRQDRGRNAMHHLAALLAMLTADGQQNVMVEHLEVTKETA